MRESGSREKNAAVPCQPNFLASCCASLGRKEKGKVVPSKERAVILGEPICWRCWATDLNRNELRKVVPSKECGGPLAITLAASRANGLGRAGHEENWFLRKKYGTWWWGLTPGFRSEQRE